MNPALDAIEPSLIRAINARKREGDIDLGLGEPTLRPSIEPFHSAVERVAAEGCPYSPNAGLAELRGRVAGYLELPQVPTADEVCITVGSEEAIYLAIKALVDPARDEVLIVEPCYLAYPKICTMEGLRHRMVPLDSAAGFPPDARAVLAALGEDTRLIVINSPANPTGRVWPADELRLLSEGLLARGREHKRIWILSDEVYRELYYGSEPPCSAGSVHPWTLTAGSLSKSSALTGLRLGWLAGPREVMTQAIKAHQFVNTAASTLSQYVALELFRARQSLGAHREWYRTQRETLLASASAEGLELIPPEGAFYAMLRLPPPWSADSVGAAEALLEDRRVVTVPGRAFGGSAEGWLRISWVAPRDELVQGLRRIGSFVRDA